MKNRFKFRVWSKQYGRYIQDNEYPIGGDYSLSMTQYGYVEVIGLGDYEEGSDTTHSWGCVKNLLEYIGECIVEQCTGLKDKNGKLIYEGDIVKKEFKNKPFSSKAKTKEKLIKFKWNDVEACFSFDFLNEKDKHDDFQCWESGWKDKYSDDEIIGNIHENADLLEI